MHLVPRPARDAPATTTPVLRAQNPAARRPPATPGTCPDPIPHHRRPPPWSHPGQPRRHTPHLPRSVYGTTRKHPRVSSSPSNPTTSTTTPSTPNRATHTAVGRTPPTIQFRTLQESRTHNKQPVTPTNRQHRPTKTTGEPQKTGCTYQVPAATNGTAGAHQIPGLAFTAIISSEGTRWFATPATQNSDSPPENPF